MDKDKKLIEVAILALTKTIEMIYFSFQVEKLFKDGKIRPDQLEKKIKANGELVAILDWEKDPEMLKNNATNMQFAASRYYMMTCKETYSNVPKVFVKNKEDNPELHAAQKIQKIVRDTHGHFAVTKDGFNKPIYNSNFSDLDFYEIKSIGVVFDARNRKKGEEFDFEHLGGLMNYLRVLEYLREDLKNRLKK